MDRPDEAVETFLKGYNCAQAVLSTYSPADELPAKVALLISNGFGGGLGRQGEVCGAVTGAIMALGLLRGSSEVDAESKVRLYAAVQRFSASFKTCHGSILCRELLNLDLNTEEGRSAAKERDVTRTVCQELVRDAAVILEQILAEDKAEG
jgi:C_GCAxxG_C_C family probable redox protein